MVTLNHREQEQAVIGGSSLGSKSNTTNSSSSPNPNSHDFDDISLKLGLVIFLHLLYITLLNPFLLFIFLLLRAFFLGEDLRVILNSNR